MGRALGLRAIFAERQENVLTLRRGFTLSADDRVVIIEDVVTTVPVPGTALVADLRARRLPDVQGGPAGHKTRIAQIDRVK